MRPSRRPRASGAAAIAFAALLALVAGCGTKGPLQPPPKSAAASTGGTAPAGPTTAPPPAPPPGNPPPAEPRKP